MSLAVPPCGDGREAGRRDRKGASFTNSGQQANPSALPDGEVGCRRSLRAVAGMAEMGTPG